MATILIDFTDADNASHRSVDCLIQIKRSNGHFRDEGV
jgi:hypothetical protein